MLGSDLGLTDASRKNNESAAKCDEKAEIRGGFFCNFGMVGCYVYVAGSGYAFTLQKVFITRHNKMVFKKILKQALFFINFYSKLQQKIHCFFHAACYLENCVSKTISVYKII